MTTVSSKAKVVKSIAASAEAVWQQLSKFDRLQAGGNIESVSYEGEGVGMIRTINLANGSVIERLDKHDADTRTFSYSILNDDSPLPFSNYSATVVIVDDGNNSSTVEWTGSFDTKGVPEADAINVATGIYAGAIKGAKQALNVG